jgi:polyisoprenyl-phosphate glycosyltransferase
MLPKISIVIPVFQNEASIAETCGAISAELDTHSDEMRYAFVLVNDGSRDRSWDVLRKLKDGRPQSITLINLTRNFGQVAALLAGYLHADGDCIASIAADQQEPPELVWRMFCAWRDGHKLVVGSRSSRDDGLLNDLISNAGWSLLRRHVAQNIPRGGFDVFVMDRELRDFYVRDPEQHIFMQGRLLFYGHPPFIVPYERRKRLVGRSQTRFARRVTYFIDGFAAYSYLPLRLVSAIGILLFTGAILASGVIAWYVMSFGTRVEGWASLMIVVLFLNGIQLLAIGVLGEYLWRTLQEVRRRPHYIIESVWPAGAPEGRAQKISQPERVGRS